MLIILFKSYLNYVNVWCVKMLIKEWLWMVLFLIWRFCLKRFIWLKGGEYLVVNWIDLFIFFIKIVMNELLFIVVYV